MAVSWAQNFTIKLTSANIDILQNNIVRVRTYTSNYHENKHTVKPQQSRIFNHCDLDTCSGTNLHF